MSGKLPNKRGVGSESSSGGQTNEPENQDQESVTTTTTNSVIATVKSFGLVVIKNLPLNLAAVAAGLLLIVLIMVVVIYVKVTALDSVRIRYKALQSLSSTLQENFTKAVHAIKVKRDLIDDQLNAAVVKFSSCPDIYRRNPSSSSGYYPVRSSTGQLTSVYCDMTEVCGILARGWMRVAKLDIDNCPTGFRSELVSGQRRSCVVEEDKPGCTPVLYSSFNILYTKVCGKISGYGVGKPEGFRSRREEGGLASNYLDGVSVTSGSNHIMSFAGGSCRCSKLPDYVDNYVCDNVICDASKSVCWNRRLWTHNLCGPPSPFFYKELSAPTSADIKLRVCRDEHRNNEDIAITVIGLYVQ